MTEAANADAAIDGCPWMVRSGYFRQVVGYQQAAELLNDDRLHADMVGLFKGLGVTSGPLFEVMRSSFLSINGAEHKRLRSLVAGMFTPRAVESVRPAARQTAQSLAAAMGSRGGGDFLTDFARPYVADVTCGYLGFPPEDLDGALHAIEELSHATRDLGNRLDECTNAIHDLISYARRALEFRRQRPDDDVLTLIADLVDNDRLSEMVALGLVAGLLSAGVEPSVNQLGLMLMVLAEREDAWNALPRGELNLARSVEESLRLRSTNQGVNRVVTEPFDHEGQHLNQGEQILIGLGAVNKDPTRFPRPHDFDLEANTRPHMAFGFGAHYCLGAALARVQMQEALDALTSSLGCPTIVASEVHEGGGLTSPLLLQITCSLR